MGSILITGARGMLGSMLAEVLADQNPVGWDKEELDITDLEQTREKISTLGPDVIINAAAYTDVDGAASKHDLAFAVNETGVRNLAIAAKEINATLVHYSTDYVFSGDREEGYNESDTPGPAANIYGESKLAGEKTLQAITPNFYLIRTAWLYGPNGKNFVETMLKIAATKKILQIVNDQHGSPTFTKDVAMFTKQLLAKPYPPGIYHATNSGQTTWFGFAQKIFEFAGISVELTPVKSDQFPRPAARPASSVLRHTQGPIMRPWQDALKEYIESR